jgi:hypothetical protein
MPSVLLVGGFKPGQSLWSIKHGFEKLGYHVVYQPTRGCMEDRKDPDIALAKEEGDIIPPSEDWNISYKNYSEFTSSLLQTIDRNRPELLLWWFSKDDKQPGLISEVRKRFPWCKTVTHTQDDPWDVLRNPQYSDEFEYTATCCKESVEVYAERTIKAIVLYPPPAMELHRVARPSAPERCEFSVTILTLYAKQDVEQNGYLESSDRDIRLTFPLGFPDQRALRKEMVDALKDLGRIHIYGGLGFGTFEDIPRTSYRGFRTYFELPTVYRSAKININQHNSPEAYGYLNQRDTAITGSGGFMLTDYVAGMEEVFEIGEDIDTWKTLDEMHEKAEWWLAHDAKRQAAGRRAQSRILQEYGNRAYARKLLDFVQNN